MGHTKKPLRDQVIVVTGASSGNGLATARMAARRGARVVLVARNARVLAAEQSRIAAEGGRAIHVVADVGSRDAVEAVSAAAMSAFGGFDTWVNVAGLTIYGRLADVSEADHRRLVETNFWGTVHGSLVAVGHLRHRGGALINVGSVASDLAFPLQGMYCASKHAIKGFTDALRMELALDGAPVSVTLVKPTSIDTRLPQRARNYMDREPSLPPPVYTAEEVAEAILSVAVTPRRDVYVGGGGKALAALYGLSPAAIDVLAPAVAFFEKRGEPPRDPEGALYAPVGDGQTAGTYPGYVLKTSLYTRAALNPLTTAAVATGVGLAAALVVSRRNARRS